jgi:nucleotide-binding universal stress UspA family protein
MLEILINTEEMTNDNPVVRTGLALASRHNAYATGLNIVEVFPSCMAMPDVMTVLETEEYEAKQCDTWWMNQCREHGVQGGWEVIRGVYVPVLARRSCMADITVSRLPNREAGYPTGMDYVTRVLLSAASPMLLVPPKWEGNFRQERILVAWNSTQESMRALRAAVPFLREAEMVCLIDGASDEVPGIAPPPLPVHDWLTRQGIKLHSTQPFPSTTKAGAALLNKAYAMHADLLVMGAWGHSRVSELILGGTTRHVLEHAELPVLLAH